MAERVLSKVQAAELFFAKVRGVTLRSKAHSRAIRKTLNVEQLLQIERS